MPNPFRTEHDFLGDKQIPADAYWGVHTARAVENFAISGTPLAAMPQLIRALAFVKKAAARANAELGALDGRLAAAIMGACDELIAGKHLEQFVVDVIQGGAGTSTNMNANEVIANLALERLGHGKGRDDLLHPNDHVNASQSANDDVYPTAVRLALWAGIDGLLDSMAPLRRGFEAKSQEFADVLKIGRTQLQDAVPMTLGQECSTYAVMLEEESEAGQLQLNAFEPIMGWSLFKSITHLSNACLTLNKHCVAGIEANRDLLARRVRESITLVTALNPLIGYEKAALVAKRAMATGAPIDEVAQALGFLTKEQVEALLVAGRLTEPLRRES